MQWQEIIGIIAGLVAILEIIPYIRSILRGETKPERASWFIWTIVSAMVLLTYFDAGARSTAWVALAYAIYPIIIFIMSFKYGVGGFTRLDIVCLVGAAIGFICWILTDDPRLALYINLVVDTIGFIPTIKKVYFKPKTENRIAWQLALLAGVLNLFAITSLEFYLISYPIFLVVNQAIVVGLITFPKLRLNRT